MIIEPLSLHAIAVMVFTMIGLYLFSRDWIPIETTGLGILVAMISLFYFFPYDVNGIPIEPAYFFVSSFGHEALVTICALLAIGKAIEISGSLQPLIGFLSTSWTKHPKISFLGVLFFGAFFSAFINNTPIVVICPNRGCTQSQCQLIKNSNAHGNGNASWRDVHNHWYVHKFIGCGYFP